jgi:hypothetical protein
LSTIKALTAIARRSKTVYTNLAGVWGSSVLQNAQKCLARHFRNPEVVAAALLLISVITEISDDEEVEAARSRLASYMKEPLMKAIQDAVLWNKTNTNCAESVLEIFVNLCACSLHPATLTVPASICRDNILRNPETDTQNNPLVPEIPGRVGQPPRKQDTGTTPRVFRRASYVRLSCVRLARFTCVPRVPRV